MHSDEKTAEAKYALTARQCQEAIMQGWPMVVEHCGPDPYVVHYGTRRCTHGQASKEVSPRMLTVSGAPVDVDGGS